MEEDRAVVHAVDEHRAERGGPSSHFPDPKIWESEMVKILSKV